MLKIHSKKGEKTINNHLIFTRSLVISPYEASLRKSRNNKQRSSVKKPLRLPSIQPSVITKSFVIEGEYPDIREALLKRGWEELHPSSKNFEFKWTRSARLPEILFENQMINHLAEIFHLSTKTHLTKNLEVLTDKDSFFPKSFILQNEKTFTKFVQFFKKRELENILKKFLDGKVEKRRAQEAYKSLKLIKQFKTFEGKRESLDFKEKVRAFLKGLKKNPQCNICNKENVYIVKPGFLSRGRNIIVSKSLQTILKHARQLKQAIVQKYIENPLLINSKKFDIRQWVLLTTSPLQVYFYKECYLRFAPCDYNPTEVSNLMIHLTNNSVVKHCPEFVKEQSMWDSAAFQVWLNKHYPPNAWQSIQKTMKLIVKKVVKSVEDKVSTRGRCCELLGFDFMVDEDLKVWLLEVNTSPAMDYSTSVTQKLVKQVLNDTICVFIDNQPQFTQFELI